MLDGLGLARGVFAARAGSVDVDAYVSLAGYGAHDRIEPGDIDVVNRTAGARAPEVAWSRILNRPLPSLAAIALDVDLIEFDDARWQRSDGEGLVRPCSQTRSLLAVD